jgi:hypothetical protein
MVNLNLLEDQYLSVEPATHRLSSGATSGFTLEAAAEAELFRKKRQIVGIPPGHMAIFYENIKHEVRTTAYGHDTYRKFLGFRLTRSTGMLYPENAERFERQAPLVHKGGDVAPMYPALYPSNHVPLLERFGSLRFENPLMFHSASGPYQELADAVRACADCAKGSCQLFWHGCSLPQGHTLPQGRLKKECPSLRELECMYTPYTDEELAKFYPQPIPGVSA